MENADVAFLLVGVMGLLLLVEIGMTLREISGKLSKFKRRKEVR